MRSSTARPILAGALRVGILLIPFLAVGAYLRPGWSVINDDVQSRSPYCSRLQGVFDARVQAAQDRAAERILKRSRRVTRDGRIELWDTPAGPYWVPSDNNSGVLLAFLLAQQERDIYGNGEWSVQPGDVVLDCGAHVGVYTRKALQAGASRVVAIEPAPAAVACLRRNFAREIATGTVMVYPKGVWDREDLLTFYENGNSDAADSFVVHFGNSREIRVPVTSIDTLAEELKLRRVDFIKADIKGATQRMITGARQVIARDHPRLALSTEEPPENPESLALLLDHFFPGRYRKKCGPCFVVNGEISTDVIFLR